MYRKKQGRWNWAADIILCRYQFEICITFLFLFSKGVNLMAKSNLVSSLACAVLFALRRITRRLELYYLNAKPGCRCRLFLCLVENVAQPSIALLCFYFLLFVETFIILSGGGGGWCLSPTTQRTCRTGVLRAKDAALQVAHSQEFKTEQDFLRTEPAANRIERSVADHLITMSTLSRNALGQYKVRCNCVCLIQ